MTSNQGEDGHAKVDRPRRSWELLKYGTPIAAITAALLQGLAYAGYDYFYTSLGVSPDEVGFSYSNVLGRSALQIALFTVLALFFLWMLGLVSFYLWALASSDHWLNMRRRMLESEYPGRTTRVNKSVGIAALVTTLLLYSFAFFLPKLLVIAIVAGAIVLVATDYNMARKAGAPASSILYNLHKRMYYSAFRLFFLLGLTAIMAAGVRSKLLAVFFAWILLVSDRALPFTNEFATVPPADVVRTARRWWFRRIAVLFALLAIPVGGILFVENISSLIRLSGFEASVSAVRQGESLVDPYALNPFSFGKPRALVVRATWIGDSAPALFIDRGTGQPISVLLTYLGQSAGTAVLFDTTSGTSCAFLPVACYYSATWERRTQRASLALLM